MIKKSRLLRFYLPILSIASLLVALYLTDHLPFIHRRHFVAATSANQYTKGEKIGSLPVQTGSTNPGSSTSGTDKINGTAATGPLITPWGNFVSNHHPNLSGNPAPNTLNSTCTTTPGAVCQIIFTKDGLSQSLPPETTDAGGTAYWNNWNLQTYDLSQGSWSIKAIATLNGQSKTATDALNLEVSQ